MNPKISTVLILTAFLILNIPTVAAEPATASDCGIFARDLATANCGDLTVDVAVDEASCMAIDSTSLLCSVVSSASATASSWVNPGSVEVILPCGDAVRGDWLIGGTVSPVENGCTEANVFTRGTCTELSVRGDAVFDGLASPLPLNATASTVYCAPVPEGAAITLYQDALFGGCSIALSADVSDFAAHEYDTCPGVSPDDSVSSLVLRDDCTAILYEEAESGGASKLFLPGEHTFVGLDFDDLASSMDVDCLL